MNWILPQSPCIIQRFNILHGIGLNYFIFFMTKPLYKINSLLVQCDEFRSAAKLFLKNKSEFLSQEMSHYNRQSLASYTSNSMKESYFLRELYSKKGYYSSALNFNMDDLVMPKLSQRA